MKERPILFSGPMVRAILDGRKTQTRRIVKPQPYIHPDDDNGWIIDYKKHPYAWPERFFDGTVKCHFGKLGDSLWVREKWATYWRHNTSGYVEAYNFTGPIDLNIFNGKSHTAIGNAGGIEYAATYPDGGYGYSERIGQFVGEIKKWRSSIHMPRWASRIDLEITNVRVERLQDISEEDAIAEGVDYHKCPTTQTNASIEAQRIAHRIGMAAEHVSKIDYIGGYRTLWESINGEGSWDANPWVWVVEFKRI